MLLFEIPHVVQLWGQQGGWLWLAAPLWFWLVAMLVLLARVVWFVRGLIRRVR